MHLIVFRRFLHLTKLPAKAFGLAIAMIVFFSAVLHANPPGDRVDFAPPGKITGRVKDSSGAPIAGASVSIKGTNTGTITKADGSFSLETTATSGTLEISYVGHQKQAIAFSGESVVEIKLLPLDNKVDEIIVIGYGTQKEKNISGAVSTISPKQIAASPSPNLSNALVGRTAGIIAVQRSGAPGSDGSDIFVRGVGTTGDATPIYVIDGIVRPQADFAQLNPAEIESFTVLKDAASAAVFGVRGGNGVILVTTKRGATGRIQISYNANVGVQTMVRTPEKLNAYEFASLYNEAMANDGKPAQYSDDVLQKYKDHSDPDAYPDVNWYGTLNKNPLITQHDLSATGGTNKVRYATSLSYMSQDGLIPSNNFKRYNYRSNIDADVTNTTTLSFDLAGRNEITRNIYNDGNLWVVLMNTPALKFPVRYSNGDYPAGPSYTMLPDNGYRKTENNAFRGRLQLVQKLPFVSGLSVKGLVAYDRSFTSQKNWYYPVIPFYSRNPDGTFVEQALPPNSLYQDYYDDRSITAEAHLNYERRVGVSNITGLLLYTQTKQVWSDINAYREGYTINIDELNFGGAANRNNGGYSGSSGRRGIVGRLNYTYDDKYIIEGSFREDASEQFASDKRWGFFPSGSVGYVISRENFLKSSPWLSFLKFRASYGVLGNDRIGNARFLYLRTFNPGGPAIFGDGQAEPTIMEGRLPNVNVTWETVKKLDVGFDATFFNGKVNLTFDYFQEKRSNILGQRIASVPDLLGIGLPVENYAKVNNQGIELSLGHKNSLSNGLRYSINGNITYAKNKVVFIDEPASTNPNIKRTGLPLGTAFGFKALGIFQTQDEIDKAASQPGNMAPGDLRMQDTNKDGKIDDDDRVAIGTSNVPQIIYGLNGSVNFKNFELSFLFQGASRVNQYISDDGAWPFVAGAGGASGLKRNLDAWSPTNTHASEPRVLVSPNNLNHAYSSFWMVDVSYLRLRNLELAYYLPKRLLEKTRAIQGLRLYVNANNLFTSTKLKNFDPETSNNRGYYYPQLRIINAGLNVQF